MLLKAAFTDVNEILSELELGLTNAFYAYSLTECS